MSEDNYMAYLYMNKELFNTDKNKLTHLADMKDFWPYGIFALLVSSMYAELISLRIHAHAHPFYHTKTNCIRPLTVAGPESLWIMTSSTTSIRLLTWTRRSTASWRISTMPSTRSSREYQAY